MSIFRLMSILQGASNDPKDRYVNVLHLNADAGLDADDVATTIATAMEPFWETVDTYIPQSVTRQEFRLYNLDDPEPREPTYMLPLSTPTSTAPALPYEVAATLSFYATRNIRSYRGRIFLGPLTQDIVVPGAVNADPQILPTARQEIVDAFIDMCQDIKDAGTPGSVRVGVYSPTDGVIREVTDCWMDNAFDTIRARGTAASARTEASLPD